MKKCTECKENSDLNLNAFEDLLAADKLFALENMLKIC